MRQKSCRERSTLSSIINAMYRIYRSGLKPEPFFIPRDRFRSVYLVITATGFLIESDSHQIDESN